MKPTKRQFDKAMRACIEAGCDPNVPYWELSPEAKSAWSKHYKTIIGYIGPPIPEQIEAIIDGGIGFSA